jgi:hypothetical protein
MVWLALIAAATQVSAQPSPAPRPHRHHPHRFYPLPVPPFQPQIAPPPPAPNIEIAPPPPAPAPTPTPAPALRSGGPSYPGGMSITVTKLLHEDRGKDRAPSTAALNTPKQAAEQLAACWAPPIPPKGETVEITIRFSFNGRGGIMGAPRTTFVKPPRGSTADDVRNALRDAIRTCSPLRFTKSMAASAPGYPLAVRFIGRRADDE